MTRPRKSNAAAKQQKAVERYIHVAEKNKYRNAVKYVRAVQRIEHRKALKAARRHHGRRHR